MSQQNQLNFYGQGSCYAFHPVYSGEHKYTVCIIKFLLKYPLRIFPEYIWEEAHSIDDCIQMAIWRIIPFQEIRNIFVVIYDEGGNVVKTYLDTDDLVQDLWKSFSNVPFDDSEKDLELGQDWYIFQKGTEREDIWQWFDAHYSELLRLLNSRASYWAPIESGLFLCFSYPAAVVLRGMPLLPVA